LGWTQRLLAAKADVESALAEGLLFERRALHAAFSLRDRNEGMSAFIEKRLAKFTNS
jgi:enoyl-CoA hydratase